MKTTTKQIKLLNLDEDSVARLAAEAKRTDKSQSRIVRELIRAHLPKVTAEEPQYATTI